MSDYEDDFTGGGGEDGDPSYNDDDFEVEEEEVQGASLGGLDLAPPFSSHDASEAYGDDFEDVPDVEEFGGVSQTAFNAAGLDLGPPSSGGGGGGGGTEDASYGADFEEDIDDEIAALGPPSGNDTQDASEGYGDDFEAEAEAEEVAGGLSAVSLQPPSGSGDASYGEDFEEETVGTQDASYNDDAFEEEDVTEEAVTPRADKVAAANAAAEVEERRRAQEAEAEAARKEAARKRLDAERQQQEEQKRKAAERKAEAARKKREAAARELAEKQRKEADAQAEAARKRAADAAARRAAAAKKREAAAAVRKAKQAAAAKRREEAAQRAATAKAEAAAAAKKAAAQHRREQEAAARAAEEAAAAAAATATAKDQVEDDEDYGDDFESGDASKGAEVYADDFESGNGAQDVSVAEYGDDFVDENQDTQGTNDYADDDFVDDDDDASARPPGTSSRSSQSAEKENQSASPSSSAFAAAEARVRRRRARQSAPKKTSAELAAERRARMKEYEESRRRAAEIAAAAAEQNGDHAAQQKTRRRRRRKPIARKRNPALRPPSAPASSGAHHAVVRIPRAESGERQGPRPATASDPKRLPMDDQAKSSSAQRKYHMPSRMSEWQPDPTGGPQAVSRRILARKMEAENNRQLVRDRIKYARDKHQWDAEDQDASRAARLQRKQANEARLAALQRHARIQVAKVNGWIASAPPPQDDNNSSQSGTSLQQLPPPGFLGPSADDSRPQSRSIPRTTERLYRDILSNNKECLFGTLRHAMDIYDKELALDALAMSRAQEEQQRGNQQGEQGDRFAEDEKESLPPSRPETAASTGLWSFDVRDGQSSVLNGSNSRPSSRQSRLAVSRPRTAPAGAKRRTPGPRGESPNALASTNRRARSRLSRRPDFRVPVARSHFGTLAKNDVVGRVATEDGNSKSVDVQNVLSEYYQLMGKLSKSLKKARAPNIVQQVLFSGVEAAVSPRRRKLRKSRKRSGSRKQKQPGRLSERESGWVSSTAIVDSPLASYDSISDYSCAHVATPAVLNVVKKTRDLDPYTEHVLRQRINQRMANKAAIERVYRRKQKQALRNSRIKKLDAPKKTVEEADEEAQAEQRAKEEEARRERAMPKHIIAFPSQKRKGSNDDPQDQNVSNNADADVAEQIDWFSVVEVLRDGGSGDYRKLVEMFADAKSSDAVYSMEATGLSLSELWIQARECYEALCSHLQIHAAHRVGFSANGAPLGGDQSGRQRNAALSASEKEEKDDGETFVPTSDDFAWLVGLIRLLMASRDRLMHVAFEVMSRERAVNEINSSNNPEHAQSRVAAMPKQDARVRTSIDEFREAFPWIGDAFFWRGRDLLLQMEQENAAVQALVRTHRLEGSKDAAPSSQYYGGGEENGGDDSQAALSGDPNAILSDPSNLAQAAAALVIQEARQEAERLQQASGKH